MAASDAPMAASHLQSGNASPRDADTISAAGVGVGAEGVAGKEMSGVFAEVGTGSAIPFAAGVPCGVGCCCPAGAVDRAGAGRRVEVAAGAVPGRAVGACVGAVAGVAAEVAAGPGLASEERVGDADGMVRGPTGTTPLSSTGPCARGVLVGEGLGGRLKSLTDCAAAGVAASKIRPRATVGREEQMRIETRREEVAGSRKAALNRP